ncbi:MAG TPA: hypothetical protein VM554_14560 [Acidisarcina sp.]|nr:hypothetical protein [Acidisarcina sp.]
MLIQNLQSSVWMAGLVGHLLLVMVLLVRGRVARFPLFTALIIFYIVRTATPQMPFTHTLQPGTYMWLFWGFEIGDVILRALVLGELLRLAFKGTEVPLARVAAWSAVAVALSVALAVLAGPMQRMLVWSIFAKGNLAVAILSLLALVALIWTRGKTHLPWRSHIFAISSGLAFYALIFLSLQAMQLWGGSAANPHGEHAAFLRQWMQASAAVAYLAVVLYWVVSLWLDDGSARSAARGLRKPVAGAGPSAA